VGEDWPLAYDELEPYYGEAEAELGVAGSEDNPFAGPRSGRYPLPAFPVGYDERFVVEAASNVGIRFHSLPQARTSEAYRGRPACATFSACRARPIRARYSGDIHIEHAESTGHVTVVPGANVIRLETDPTGREVRRAIVATEDGREQAIAASAFIIAAHAVESARLLLLSASSQHPAGLANSSGLVGRGFMEHRSLHRVAKLPFSLHPFRKGFQTIISQQFHADAARGDEAAFLLSSEAVGPRFPFLLRGLTARSGQWGEAFAREIEEEVQNEYGRYLLLRFASEPRPWAPSRSTSAATTQVRAAWAPIHPRASSTAT
jgi:glucose dehydrogenase